MAKVYFVRHQAAGILTDYPFSQSPTQEQQDRLATLCFQRHGLTHKKTNEPYWLNVVELETLGLDDLPEIEPPSLSVVNEAKVGSDKFSVAATGTVTPQKGK